MKKIIFVLAVLSVCFSVYAQKSDNKTVVLTDPDSTSTDSKPAEKKSEKNNQYQDIFKRTDPKDRPAKFNPERDSLVYAFAGYGYYNWKMISANDFMGFFGGPKYGIDYKHESTPFILKKYGVRANILFFTIGLDYFGDKWVALDRDDAARLEKSENKAARQLKMISGISYGDYSFYFNVLHSDFNSTITSKGFVTSIAGTQPFTYYREDGSSVQLDVGDKASWYTVYTEYEIRAERSKGLVTQAIGAKFVKFDAPTQLNITNESASYGASDVMMFTSNELFYLFYSFKKLNKIYKDFYYSMVFPINISGYYRTHNDFFDSGRNPFSGGFSYALASNGNLSLMYLMNYFKIETGFDYNLSSSMLTKTGIETNRSLAIITTSTGASQNIPAGSKVSLLGSRLEFFYGFYFHACAFF